MSLFTEPQTIIKPRKYQLDAFEAVKVYLQYREGHPCVVLPVGSGKTILIALLCQWVCSWGGRVLILAHVKELLEQAADKLNQIAPELHVGVYSAGLDRRETAGQVTIGGVQSIYKKASEFEAFDLLIIDECHLLAPDGEGMYRTFIKDAQAINPNLRIVGLTATPFRLSSGALCGPNELLTAVCYEAFILDLINQGYLAKLRSKHVQDCDTSNIHIRGGEFNAEEIAILMNGEATVTAAVENLIDRTEDRNSVLIFCSGVEHAASIRNALTMRGQTAATVIGDTESDERARILKAFKNREIKYLTNFGVLTTGFDAPCIDAIALLRPTMSPGLYVQMIGRGTRLHESKTDTLILDFAGNIQRHGPVNMIRPEKKHAAKGTGSPLTKTCPKCQESVILGTRICPDCGYQWTIDDTPTKHGFKPSNDSIIADGVAEPIESPVYDVKYSVHTKKGAEPDAPKTLRVDYVTVKGGLITRYNNNSVISEWVCVEHDPGYALTKAQLWWGLRSNDPFPRSAKRAVDIADGGGLATPSKIWTSPDPKNPKYSRIVKYELGEKPEAAEVCECGGAGCVKCEFDFGDVSSSSESESGGVSGTDWDDAPF